MQVALRSDPPVVAASFLWADTNTDVTSFIKAAMALLLAVGLGHTTWTNVTAGQGIAFAWTTS